MINSKKICITYFANARFPTEKAHGIQIAKTCEAFVASGVDLTLVVPKRGKWEDPFLFYGLTQTFKIKRILSLNIAISTRIGFSLSAVFFAISSFFYMLFHRRQDIVYSIDMDNVSYFGFALAIRFFKKPGFIEMHSPKKNTFVHRLLFKNINGVITINETIKNTLTQTFPYINNIIVCPNGVDIKKYNNLEKQSSRKILKLPANKTLIVYTGSFQDWKGIDTTLSATKNLNECQFYFIGGTEKDLKKLGFKDKISNNVHFMGKRNFKEMPLWHTSADILLVTGTNKNQYSSLHTSPMKLFEYMAARRPIVASRTRAIEHIVSSNEVFFHTPDDADDLVQIIKTVLQHTNNIKQKVHAAYEMSDRYSWQNRAEMVLKNFRKI